MFEKTAIITGGGYGVGAAIARKFGQLGYQIAIIGRSEERLRQHSEELTAEGIHCISYACDASRY